MNIKENAMSVLHFLYNSAEAAKTLNLKLSYNDIHDVLSDMDIDTIKLSIEYLAGHGFVTYSTHLVYQDICLTSAGVDHYLNSLN